ncbi:FecR family protein [Mucilaginibacter pedocola]|uniref:FecR family protein n=1 Tax=Mucilaginibacter pedocola TaxID=1792845 RepID=A0A1S9P9S0_9SPHI|nr:FecR family protein [Mucilaginibacter pedocola]OOQ57710.1 hypothetical protein BC343_13015 [Mucilaginibacter pedocola]
MTNKYNPEELLARYRAGICTPEEKALVESWHLQQLREKPTQPDLAEMDAAKGRMWQHITADKTRVKRLNKQWLQYAAAILVFAGLGIWLWRDTTQLPAPGTSIAKSKPIVPGSNKAVLTLASGKQVVLDGTSAGIIANEGDVAVVKNTNGSIQYNNGDKTGQTAYNTLSIPRGGTYSLILADGTKVWLNSASTIKYPTAFTGNQRAVEITGEAYFEVAKNKAMPFVVSTPGQKIQVLGTHFNVHAYSDEKTAETTLLEGKIAISKGSQTEILTPGQQAINAEGIAMRIVNMPDAEDAIAWKNGYLSSSHESIYSLMTRISRWYDVDIEYKGNFEGRSFGGTISKFGNVKDVLNIIESTGSVHFKIQERRIIVMP